MKRIVALFALLTAVLPVVAQGRELPPEHGSDRTCYSADGTKIYRYYDDYMIARQVGKDIPGELLTTQPDWFSPDMDSIEQLYNNHKADFRAIIEKFQLEGYRAIIIKIHVSLKTGKYAMSEIWLRKRAVALADQLPLDYLFSLCDGLELKSRIRDHEPCKDDNKYTTYFMYIG